MVDKKERSGLAGYLGQFADKVFMDNRPIVQSDEYTLNTYCRVKIKSDNGDTYQNVPVGPVEVYGYPDGDQTKEATFKGILDGNGYLIPCHKNEKGNFEIISEDQQIQIIPSAANLAAENGLPQTILKTNLLNHESVFQSEKEVKSPDGKSFRESEAYTLIHTSAGKTIGPIEYYLQPQDGRGKAEFLGLLGTDGQLVACTRNAEGNFEFEDENHQKQIIQSAKNELAKDTDKYYQVVCTDYFMGRPIQQRTMEEHGLTYTKTYTVGDQPIGPIEYYTQTPGGRVEFAGLLDANGQIFPCTRNADGDFEIENANGEKQVVKSSQNELKDMPGADYKIIRTDYAMGKPGKQTVLPKVEAYDATPSRQHNFIRAFKGTHAPGPTQKGDLGGMGGSSR